MAKIIDGRALAEKIKDEIAQEIFKLNGPRPNLAIILIGEREDSKLYVSLKEKEAKRVGIDTHLYKCPSNVSEQEILEIIKYLNNDRTIDAILVQLPLPAGFDTDSLILSLSPEKDVDRFHPANLKILFSTCEHGEVMPPVLGTILEILKSIDYEIKNKKACLVVNSEIFGQSLKQILKCRGAEVELARFKDADLKEKTKKADILISAIGEPEFIKKDFIKKDAVVIDIGIAKKDGRVKGDVDSADVEDQAGYLTPVPGGVGPLTIAMLFKNTLALYKKRHNSNS